MSTYIITPSTTASPINETISSLTLRECKGVCGSDGSCTAFVYQQSTGGCNLIKTPISNIIATPTTSDFGLYVKGSRSNFWWVWLFCAILIILIFFLMCKKRS